MTAARSSRGSRGDRCNPEQRDDEVAARVKYVRPPTDLEARQKREGWLPTAPAPPRRDGHRLRPPAWVAAAKSGSTLCRELAFGKAVLRRSTLGLLVQFPQFVVKAGNTGPVGNRHHAATGRLNVGLQPRIKQLLGGFIQRGCCFVGKNPVRLFQQH